MVLVSVKKIPPWKLSIWDSVSVEAAMMRAPIVILFAMFLWGINLWLFERIRLQYYNVLLIRTASLQFIFLTATTFAFLYVLNMSILMQGLGLSLETGIALFYLLSFILAITPGVPGHDSRASFSKLFRSVIFPCSPISFPEVLLADALTSMSKVFKDIAVAIIAILARVSGTSLVDHHDFGMILIALLASLPYGIRVIQCYCQFVSAPDSISRIPIFLNIIKYLTAFPPIWLAAIASLGYTIPNLVYMSAYASVLNSLYSYLWDVFMDWGLLIFHRNGKCTMRPRWFISPIFHLLACVVNLILRFSWMANRFYFLSSMPSAQLVLVVQLAELSRRSMWNVFRVEWEVISQQDRLAGKSREDIRIEDDDKTQAGSGSSLISLK